MYISHKSNAIQTLQDSEWECRRTSKGLTNSEYWTWIATITTQDQNGNNVITYPSEDFTIVECIDEDVWKRLAQLDDYTSSTPEGTTYNIKYYVSKRDSEIVNVEAHKDEDGKDVAETYIQSHFIRDDTARDARLLVSKWDLIRIDRNNRLAETDYLALKDSTLTSNMKTYRQSLRDVPSQSDPDNITWPTKP